MFFRKLLKRLGSFCLILLAIVARVGAQPPDGVWTPRLATPTFVEPGGSVAVELRASPDLASTAWQASVANDLRSWACEVTSAQYGSINDGTESGWKLIVQLPSEIPPELFNLVVTDPKGNRMASPKAVSVVADLESDFYILHITDEHARDERAGRADGYRSRDLLRWAVPVINLINPRLLVNTGDVSYQYESNGVKKSGNQLSLYKEAREGCTVPSVIVPGNHDAPAAAPLSKKEWEKEMGARLFVTRLGSFYILNHDYSDLKLLRKAREEWEKSFADPTILFRLIAQHHDGTSGFVPGVGKPADLMLIGHVHQTKVIQSDPYPILMTVSAHKWARASYISFQRTDTGWETPEPASWSSDSAFSLVGDWGEPNVQLSFAATNDGTAVENAAIINNRLERSFDDGRVRFLMPTGTYSVTGGQILAEYSYADGTRTAVLVKVPIPAQSETTVTIEVATP